MADQQAILRNSMDSSMRTYVKNAIGIRDEDDETVEEIIQKMADHFRNKTSVAVDRVAFMKRKQEPGESFDNFYAALT